MKAIASGLIAVVVFFGAAIACAAGLFVWIDWAFSLKSGFWFIALSPIGVLILILAAMIFIMGSRGEL